MKPADKGGETRDLYVGEVATREFSLVSAGQILTGMHDPVERSISEQSYSVSGSSLDKCCKCVGAR